MEFPFPHLLFCYTIFSISGSIPIIIVLIIKSRQLLANNRALMSEKTYRLNKELIRCLIFQISIPTFILMVPFSIVIVCMLCDAQYAPYFTQANYVIGTLHSTMNTIMMIYFIKPYRTQFLYYKDLYQKLITSKEFCSFHVLQIWPNTSTEINDR